MLGKTIFFAVLVEDFYAKQMSRVVSKGGLLFILSNP